MRVTLQTRNGDERLTGRCCTCCQKIFALQTSFATDSQQTNTAQAFAKAIKQLFAKPEQRPCPAHGSFAKEGDIRDWAPGHRVQELLLSALLPDSFDLEGEQRQSPLHLSRFKEMDPWPKPQ